VLLNAAVHPFYKNMQNIPEFRALKRRIGLELLMAAAFVVWNRAAREYVNA
jgi:hypothetical protein